MQKKEKFLDFNASASGEFSRISARDQRFTILVSEQKRRVEIFCLFGGKRRFCLPHDKISGLYCWRTAGRLFHGKREQLRAKTLRGQ